MHFAHSTFFGPPAQSSLAAHGAAAEIISKQTPALRDIASYSIASHIQTRDYQTLAQPHTNNILSNT